MMNYSGAPSFFISHMVAQRAPQNMDHSRMSLAPAMPHNMAFPPPIVPPQFVQNPKYMGPPPQSAVQSQQHYYSDDRAPVYYQPVGPQPMYQSFAQPPPSHQPYAATAPFLQQQQSFEALAEQVKSLSQTTGPHPGTPQSMQQMGHPIASMPPQQVPLVQPTQLHTTHQQPYHQRHHFNQNSLSRGQTPTTTASRSNSKRSSPQNLHSTGINNTAQQTVEDYTPPGTPQDLMPLTDEQKQQYVSTMGSSTEKDIDRLSNKFNKTAIAECKSEYTPAENDVYDPNKPMEFFNQNYQNHDNKNWQHNVRNRHESGGYEYDTYNGRNDRQVKNQQPRSGRNCTNRISNDARYVGQQRLPPQSQRYQQQHPAHQNQQKPKPALDQWRPNHMDNLPSQHQPPVKQDPDRIVECSYCRMLNKPVEEYTTHNIRDANSKATCPEIQKLTCPNCNATGESAHSKYFCPKIHKSSVDLVRTASALRLYIERRKNPASSSNQHYHQQQIQHHGGSRRH